MKKGILITLAVLFSLIMVTSVYLGGFQRMEVKEGEFGRYWFVHKSHRGHAFDRA